jgi:hypothetical protein
VLCNSIIKNQKATLSPTPYQRMKESNSLKRLRVLEKQKQNKHNDPITFRLTGEGLNKYIKNETFSTPRKPVNNEKSTFVDFDKTLSHNSKNGYTVAAMFPEGSFRKRLLSSEVKKNKDLSPYHTPRKNNNYYSGLPSIRSGQCSDNKSSNSVSRLDVSVFESYKNVKNSKMVIKVNTRK